MLDFQSTRLEAVGAGDKLSATCHNKPANLSSCRLAGHKHECKKLKLAAKRAAAAAAAGADGASAADEAVCEASSASSGAAVPTAAQQKQATVSNSELPLPKALLMSDAEYRELLDGLPAGRPARPCGLSNVGNTCFANSLLQVGAVDGRYQIVALPASRKAGIHVTC